MADNAPKDKLNLKQIFGCVDMNYKGAWNEFSDEEKKSVAFWLHNRYISSVAGNRAKQERAVELVNENFNKNFNEIQSKHKQLLWQSLCTAGATGNIEFHPWIGFKKKKNAKSNNKAVKLFQQLYPAMKLDDIDLLSTMYTDKEVKDLAEQLNIKI
jgi:hypothetical protein